MRENKMMKILFFHEFIVTYEKDDGARIKRIKICVKNMRQAGRG